MVWLLVAILAVVVLAALLVIVTLAGLLAERGEADAARLELLRVEMETRRAERQLHEIARNSFQAMLEEARARSRGEVR